MAPDDEDEDEIGDILIYFYFILKKSLHKKT